MFYHICCKFFFAGGRLSRSHVSLPDWLVKNQVSGFDGQWKLDTWRFLSAEKVENREGW